MKIVRQGFALSEDDLQLIDTSVITSMMKQRLVVAFDDDPNLDTLDFSGCQGFYHIKCLGKKLYQFWFEDISDFNAFYSNIIAYQMPIAPEDK